MTVGFGGVGEVVVLIRRKNVPCWAVDSVCFTGVICIVYIYNFFSSLYIYVHVLTPSVTNVPNYIRGRTDRRRKR